MPRSNGEVFDDDEQYFRTEAPVYELQYLLFDWAANNEELFGVKYVYEINSTVDETNKSICDLIFVEDKQGFDRAKIIVAFRVAKYGIQFSEEKKKHVPKIDLFKR